MNIGEEIKQKSFDSNYHMALINILYTSNKLRQHTSLIFKPYGIQGQHYNVLRIIKGQHPEPVSPGHIKEVMLDKGRDLTRLVDRLVKEGLVHREINKENKRKLKITLTSKGQVILEEITTKLNNWYAEFQKIDEDESLILSNLLDKLRG